MPEQQWQVNEPLKSNLEKQEKIINFRANDNSIAAEKSNLKGTTINSSRIRKVPQKKIIPDGKELGFASKALFICSLPQLQPKNLDGSYILKWKRMNGNVTLELSADPEYGLPAGKDKLFGHWLKTKSVMRNDPVIHFKDGASILEEMGLDPKGDNKIWLNEVINRFLHTSISYEDGNKFRGGRFEIGHIISKMNGYFDKKTYNPNQRSFFVLGDLFFNVPGVPIDLNMLRKLGRSWFAIDFFTFINYRLWFETRNSKKDDNFSQWKPIRIPMDAYRKQCGTPTNRADKLFRFDIKQACQKLEAIGAEFKPYLDKNDVITVPIVKPTYIWTEKNQEGMKAFYAALERLKTTDT